MTLAYPYCRNSRDHVVARRGPRSDHDGSDDHLDRILRGYSCPRVVPLLHCKWGLFVKVVWFLPPCKIGSTLVVGRNCPRGGPNHMLRRIVWGWSLHAMIISIGFSVSSKKSSTITHLDLLRGIHNDTHNSSIFHLHISAARGGSSSPEDRLTQCLSSVAFPAVQVRYERKREFSGSFIFQVHE